MVKIKDYGNGKGFKVNVLGFWVWVKGLVWMVSLRLL